MDSNRRDAGRQPPKPASARRRDAAAPPTPVREAMDAPDAGCDAVVEDVEARALQLEDVEWTVRVLGRCRGRPGGVPADLMLLGFSRGADEATELECLVVGRALSALSELRLVSALREAAPPRDPDRPRSLFSGTMQRRGRKS